MFISILYNMLSLVYINSAWPSLRGPQVGKMSTGDDYGHRQGRNGRLIVLKRGWAPTQLT